MVFLHVHKRSKRGIGFHKTESVAVSLAQEFIDPVDIRPSAVTFKAPIQKLLAPVEGKEVCATSNALHWSSCEKSTYLDRMGWMADICQGAIIAAPA